MIGVVITFFGTFFDEVATSIGKTKLNQRAISIYSIGFINCLAAVSVFIIISIIKREFRFSLASLPYISAEVILNIIISTIALTAVARADRSTFGFIRVLTIPLLLIVDLFLGYKIKILQLVGIGIIILSLFLVFFYQGIKKQGAPLVLITAILPVATLSLYKYNITNYNSVAAEQIINLSVLIIYFLLMARFKAKENPFSFFKHKIFRYLALANVAPAFFIGYAYIFAPASVILSAYRSSSVFWSVVSGKAYFKEKRFLVKAACLALLVAGLILLAV